MKHLIPSSLLLTLSLLISGVNTFGQVIVDSAGTYDGTQSTIPAGVTIDQQADFGFTFWFKTSIEADKDFLSFGGTSEDSRLRQDEQASGIWMPEVEGTPFDGRIQGPYSTSTNTSDDAWHQIAYIYDYGTTDGVATLYLDGQALGSTGSFSFADATGAATIFDGDKGPFEGEFSDTAFYDSANPLTASLVTDLFDDGPGTVVIPEPSTFALLAGVLGLGLVMRRRRRS